MNYLTESQLDSAAGIPIGMPQTTVRRAEHVVVGSFVVPVGAEAGVAWLGLSVLRVAVVSGAVAPPIKISPGRPAFWAGIQPKLGKPGGVPVVGVGLDLLGIDQLDPNGLRRVSSPGLYEIIVVNNTTNLDADVVLTAQIKMA